MCCTDANEMLAESYPPDFLSNFFCFDQIMSHILFKLNGYAQAPVKLAAEFGDLCYLYSLMLRVFRRCTSCYTRGCKNALKFGVLDVLNGRTRRSVQFCESCFRDTQFETDRTIVIVYYLPKQF